MFRTLTVVDAFDKDKSDPDCWKKSVQIIKMTHPKKETAGGIALSRGVIADHHIWRGFVSADSGIADSGISGFDYYISDTLTGC
jgi:hypothetical protein